MRWKSAILNGLVGAGVMSLLMAMARAKGRTLHLELLLGIAAGRAPEQGVLTFGIAIHLLLGALFGLLYAWVFERLLHHGGIAAGLVVALPHGILASLFLAFVPAFPEAVLTPSALGTVLLHLVFGAIVGGGYGHVPEERPWLARRTP